MQWTCESNLTGFVHSYAAAAPYNTAENAKRSKPPPGARSGFVLWAVTDSCWWLCHCWAIHNFSFVATSKLNKSWGCTPFPQWVLWWCFPQVPFLFNYKPCISETFVCSSWNWPRHSKFTWWTARKADVLLKLHFAHIFLQNMAKMRCFFFFFWQVWNCLISKRRCRIIIRTLQYSMLCLFSFGAVNLDSFRKRGEKKNNHVLLRTLGPRAITCTAAALAGRMRQVLHLKMSIRELFQAHPLHEDFLSPPRVSQILYKLCVMLLWASFQITLYTC